MSAMDVFAGVCLLIVGWSGYQLGRGKEREETLRRAAARAEREAVREAIRQAAVAREAAAAPNVVDLNTRRNAS